MKQAIIILPKKSKKIEFIRQEYDPEYKKYKTHISLVYPFSNVNQKDLTNHISSITTKTKSIKIILKGLQKSKKEYYLYLTLKKGKRDISLLHKKLNSGILSGFKNKDMPKYIPHISLAKFDSKSEINQAMKEIKKDKIYFSTTIKSIYLINLNKSYKIISKKEFKLK
jgi:2'-5' RNA ligase